MIAQRTNKIETYIKKVSAYFLMLILCAPLASNAQCDKECPRFNRSDDQNCDLKKAPLTRCSELYRYVDSDKKLNVAYKALASRLDKEEIKLLKTPQRDWIKWREEKCEQIDDEANCNSGSCAGYAHDTCIVDLTKMRTKELVEFKKDIQKAKQNNFAFSKDYQQ